MAKVKSQRNVVFGYDPDTDLRTKVQVIERSARKVAICITAASTALMLLIGVSADVSKAVMGVGLMVWIPLAYKLGSSVTEFGRGYHALRSGLDGEDFAATVLGQISPEFRVVRNVLIKNARSRTGHTEIDMILIGKKAIYLVEVKNNAGHIAVDEGKAQWTVVNNDRVFSMRNPVRQASIQLKVFRDFMLRNDISCPSQAMVAFTSNEAQLSFVTPVSMPLFINPLCDMATRIRAYEDRLKGHPELRVNDFEGLIQSEGRILKGL